MIPYQIPRFFDGDKIKSLFPEGYELLPGTDQIYELELALGEAERLTEEELIKRGAYFWRINGKETYHYKICLSAPVQVDKTASIRRRTFFEANLFKTGYATHGLFPYRGKFHPQMIKAIMNIIGLKENDIVLDPMVGSGTTCIEASIIGINSIGIEKSPFCCLMSRAKVFGLKVNTEKLRSYYEEAEKIFHYFHSKKAKKSLIDFSSEKSASSPDSPFENHEYESLFKLCYLDAVGYARRRKNKTVKELFPVVLDRYIMAIENFARMRTQLGLKIGKADVREGDARNLDDIKDNSIDGIITSPPYSFAIDYLANDEPQLEYMGINVRKLRENMIGLRGKNMQERVKYYFEDMDKVMYHMSRVLKPGKYCVIVIGTNTNQLQAVLGKNQDIRIERELIKLGERHGLRFIKQLIHPIQGIRNVLRDEYILFFRKEG